MNRRSLLAVVAILAVVSVAGIGGALAMAGAGPAGVSGLFGEEKHSPALLYFESAGAQCTDDFMANSSTRVVSGEANTEITYARNVSLPGPSYAIGGPTFERVNESTYSLDIPIEETQKAPRNCSGVTRYNGTVRIPAGEDPWQLIVTHDGDEVTTIHGESNSSLLGGSSRVGQSVSAPESTANSTTSSA